MAPTPVAVGQRTIDCLQDDNIEEILVRLPSPASLARAVLASSRWRRVASSPDFLRRFRGCHPASSSSRFLGIFDHYAGLPAFHLAPSVRSDPDLAAIAREGDFLLTLLEDDPKWRLRDCANGRLLLSRGTSLCVYDPISLRRVTIIRPQHGHEPFIPPDAYIADCILRGGRATTSSSSFRVVSVQRHDRSLRAVEYDSRTLRWRFHPWLPHILLPHHRPAPYLRRPSMSMHAAGLIFLEDIRRTSSLVLDTTTMDFSLLPLPVSLTGTLVLGAPRYVVGETDYGACCLACVVDDNGLLFQVWLLKEDCAGMTWELEKETPVRDVLMRSQLRGCEVTAVAAGMALVRGWKDDGSCLLAVDLKDMKTMAEFFCRDDGFAYPFHLPWPPAGLLPPAGVQISEDRSSAE